MLPPEPRLPEARGLISQGKYFVVHAPRPIGKTTTLRTLAGILTAEGRLLAVHFSCETGEPAGDDYAAAEDQVLHAIRTAAELLDLSPELLPPDPWPDAPKGTRLGAGLRAWAARCPRPLVLFFDEIDALRGESLRSVLRQLRDGYPSKPDAFPASVVLCGLRDVRDYKAAAGGDPTRLGTASPFNVKVTSLRIGDFTPAEVHELYAQHTIETGQAFTDPAVDRAFGYTQGQPWLVNAIAAEVIDRMQIAAPTPITAEHVDEAKERLILARATHLDSLAARLGEPRVRRIIEPLIAGDLVQLDPYDDDLAYLRDLGLIAPGRDARVANPIYREVVVRVLGTGTEANIVTDPRSFVLPDGRLDFSKLLHEFADFWRQHGEVLTGWAAYHEAAPQLVIMAFMHRVVNGGGYIDREYGVGRGRIDLVVRWPYTSADGKRAWQREAAELKVWRPGKPDPLPDGLRQLDEYLDRLGLDRGTLVVFDRRDPDSSPSERTEFGEDRTPSGRPVTLLRA
ncbi:MAG: ATP-binding protein [Micromonosporaceae bacterium]|nr:ATP-binding protein [Micromonosporaceae bacterium]